MLVTLLRTLFQLSSEVQSDLHRLTPSSGPGSTAVTSLLLDQAQGESGLAEPALGGPIRGEISKELQRRNRPCIGNLCCLDLPLEKILAEYSCMELL